MKKRSFTIAEMVMALAVFGIIFAAVMTIYTRMINVKREFDARSYLLTSTYTMLEKINILLKDYTIDYEEYFNRRMAGCNSTNYAMMTGWAVGITGNCTRFDGYGNDLPLDSFQNQMGANLNYTGWHVLYYCSNMYTHQDDVTFSYSYTNANLQSGVGCVFANQPQSFGEYRLQFIDVNDDVDEVL